MPLARLGKPDFSLMLDATGATSAALISSARLMSIHLSSYSSPHKESLLNMSSS